MDVCIYLENSSYSIADFKLFNNFFSQEIPRAVYLVQELPGLQRVCPNRELSQRACHRGHRYGDRLFILQEIGVQLQSSAQELPATQVHRENPTL